jgi:hypothetical protein
VSATSIPRVGSCSVCARPVAPHFNADNRFIGCLSIPRTPSLHDRLDAAIQRVRTRPSDRHLHLASSR